MTDSEKATGAMYGLLQTFLNKNRGLFNGFMLLSNEIDRFISLRAGLQQLTAGQSQVITGITGGLTAFEDLTTASGAASKGSRATSMAIKTAVAATEGSLAIIDDLIVNEYADSHPNIVKNYTHIRRMGENGI